MMAEHWLYLPSIGIYSIVSFGLSRTIDLSKPIKGQKPFAKSVVIIFIGFLSFFAVRTVTRNIEWGNLNQFYKNMLRQSPYSPRGHLNLAAMHLSAKDYKLARQEFKTALTLDPVNPFSYYGLGLLDYLENDKTNALRHWKATLDIAPFYKPARKIVKDILYTQNKRFKNLLRAVEINPKNIMASYRLSGLYLRHGLYIEALDRLETILEIEPDYTNALFNRAWVYSKLGLYRKAISEYRKVMAITPDDPDVYRNMSLCYAALRLRKEAEIMWKEAQEKTLSQNSSYYPLTHK
jgi:tetratricopeptide (TPR) repeat protein